MAKRNQQAGINAANAANAANPANAAAQNTSTEFASETNVSQVRRQNQQSAARSGQQNNPNA